MAQVNNLSKVKIPNSLKGYTVSIVSEKNDGDIEKSVLIPSEKIFELVVKYDIHTPYVEGRIRFRDETGIFSLFSSLSIGVFLKVELLDCLGIGYICYYKITKFTRTPENTSILVDLEFSDEFSYYAGIFRFSESFKDKNTLEILNEKLPLIQSMSLTKKWDKVANQSEDSFEKRELTTLAGNKTLLQWLEWRSYLENFTILNRRTHLKIEKTDRMWGDAEVSSINLQQSLSLESPFNITEYSVIASYNESDILVDNIAFGLEEGTAKLKGEVSSLALEHGKLEGAVFSSFHQSFGMSYGVLKLDKIYSLNILEADKVVVVLNVGSLLYDIGMKVEITIPPVNPEFKGSAGILSGKYLIASVEDYIINGFFSQKLLLVRPGSSS